FNFDPKLAASMLDSVGYVFRPAQSATQGPARLRFTCILPAGFAVLERIALEVQRQLYDVGVDIQFEMLPTAEYTKRAQTGDFDAMLTDIISGPPLARPFLFWR